MILNISNIQHFSVGDGEGIRTTVFFKGCNLRCPWCHNPENLTFEPVNLWYKNRNIPEMVGRRVTIEEILPELLEDRDFFLSSNGGITFSGGEVLLQAEGAAALAKVLHGQDIPVLIDTAGCVSYEAFKKLNPVVQGYLFDFKTADADRYKVLGGDLELVAANLVQLIADKIHVQVRIPLIPGFNVERREIVAICDVLTQMGIKKVELIPFHRLGSAKYEALGMEYAYKNCQPLSKGQLLEIEKLYASYFEVILEG